jgi:cytochrome b pre-mRNA-processing protein 3
MTRILFSMGQLFVPGRRSMEGKAQSLYRSAVEAARQPVFFSEHGVPDTLDGRFDCITLHVVLMCQRLREAGEHGQGKKLAQRLFDVMFRDMEDNLREMGASDTSVGKRVKEMAKSFYGRSIVYDVGLSHGDESLHEALERNLYGGENPGKSALVALSTYLKTSMTEMADQSDAELLSGIVRFPAI